jgi:hypothetical protein
MTEIPALHRFEDMGDIHTPAFTFRESLREANLRGNTIRTSPIVFNAFWLAKCQE